MSEKAFVLPKSESPQMFDAIAKRYDFLNRVLSLGQDLRWRLCLLKCIPARPSINLLDLATGTGDVLITVAKNRDIAQGVGVDPSAGMLAIAQEKIKVNKLDRHLMVQMGNAEHLSFLNDSFDVVTISFGIRNIPDLRLALLEVFRVLKPGGTFIILEFSKPKNPMLSLGHWVYLNTVVPLIGFLLSGNLKAYQYLNQTIQDFPYGERMCKILSQFGFVSIKAIPLMFGVATIYQVQKPFES